MAPQDNDFRLPSASRRSFLGLAAGASAALAFRIVTEPMLAHARVRNVPKDAIRIDANENPLGPCASAREAVAAIIPQGGRYSDWLTDDLVKTLAEMEGLNAGAGSRLCRIERASASHGGGLHLSAAQLRDRRSRIRGRHVRRPCDGREGGEGAADEKLRARCKGDAGRGSRRGRVLCLYTRTIRRAR